MERSNSNHSDAAAGKRPLATQIRTSMAEKADYLNKSLQDELLRPSLCLSPADLMANPERLPQRPAIYGWWFQTLPPSVPDHGTLRGPFGTLLYIGIAPSGPRSQRTLRQRIKNHIRGPIASSTLRRTLASLLGAQLKLQLGRTELGRPWMSPADEGRLTEWMNAEAQVAWAVCERPWELETTLIARGPSLPLNIKGSTASFSQTLRDLRAKMGTA